MGLLVRIMIAPLKICKLFFIKKSKRALLFCVSEYGLHCLN